MGAWTSGSLNNYALNNYVKVKIVASIVYAHTSRKKWLRKMSENIDPLHEVSWKTPLIITTFLSLLSLSLSLFLSLLFTDLMSLIHVYPTFSLELDLFNQKPLSSDFISKRQDSILKPKITTRQNGAWCLDQLQRIVQSCNKILSMKYSFSGLFVKERSWILKGEHLGCV